MKVSTLKSVTTSRWIALVIPHVNKQIYTLLSPAEDFTYSTPVKSTPVISNGSSSLVRTYGRGGGSGTLYGFPVTLRQVMHPFSSFLTSCRAEGIQ